MDKKNINRLESYANFSHLTSYERTLKKLSFRTQEVVNLICIHGLTNQEAADIMGIKESGIKFHINKTLKVFGYKSMRKVIAKFYNED